MPVFEYTALNIDGRSTSGVIDADSAPAARRKLRAGKIFPVSIQEIERSTHSRTRGGLSIPGLFGRVRRRDVAMMTRQLATLVEAGFPLVGALDALIAQTRSHAFKTVLAQLKDSVVEGASFAAALSKFPSVFAPLYINMVRAGENSGTLEIVLHRLADVTERQLQLTHRIQSVLTYPLLMAVVALGVLFLLLTFIVPTITAIFNDVQRVLPLPTRLLIAVSSLLQAYWWLVAGGIAAAGLGLYRLSRSTRGRRIMDRILLHLPVVGALVVKMAVSRFARTLGSLLENGVSMLIALQIVKNMTGNRLLSDAVENAAGDVGKGRGLGAALDATAAFPELSVEMIRVGERSGALERMLAKVADVYDAEVETTVVRLTALLEPMLILFMGAVVAFIVLSICLPIFEMSELVV